MINQIDINKYAEWCDGHLHLSNAALGEEYYYNSLPFCVIDSIFAIKEDYSRIKSLLTRYCNHHQLLRIRPNNNTLPALSQQQSISSFVTDIQKQGIYVVTNNIFQYNGKVYTGMNKAKKRQFKLKTQLVYEFAALLCKNNVDYFQHVPSIINNTTFNTAALEIDGIGDLTLSYFFMLSGSDDLIKFDRWLDRNVRYVLGKTITASDALDLFTKTCTILISKYPHLTPRLLDYAVWDYTRNNWPLC